jgi:hypothetical protein
MRRALSMMFLVGCGKEIQISVNLIDPCNQAAVDSVDFLRFEPRGEDVDSDGLATIQMVSDGQTNPIPIPLVADFHLVATGHVGSFDEPPSAIGVSAKYDLTSAEGVVDIKLPFALVDQFYKTTSLNTDPTECTTMAAPRYGATATYLPENGRVLIVGGARLDNEGNLDYPRLVELYNPATGEFEAVAELRAGGARAFHTATRLSDGRVLIAGGEAFVQLKLEALRSAFVVDARDPAGVTIAEGGLAMRQARTGHTAALLGDGRVLLAGGRVLNEQAGRPEDHTYLTSVEVYDPEAQVFTLPTDMNGNAVELPTARYGHSATPLTKDDVVLAGGQNGADPVLTLDVLHIEGERLTVTTSSQTGVGPLFHSADATPDGTLLVSGGYATIADAEANPPTNPTLNVEMWTFDPMSKRMSLLCSTSLNKARGYHTASIVGQRTAVFIGGRDEAGAPIADAEVASILGARGTCFARPPTTQPMTDPRAQHAVAKVAMSGEILVVGGRQQSPGEIFGKSIDSTEVFSPRREP